MKKLLAAAMLVMVLGFANDARATQAGTWDLTLLTDPSIGSLEPMVGYFFADNLEALVTLGWNTSSFELDVSGSEEETEDNLTVQVNIIYNVPVGEGLYIPVLVGVGYFTSTLDDGTDEVTADEILFNLGLGARKMITERGAVDLFLIYTIGSGSFENGESVDFDEDELALRLGYTFFLT